MHLRYCLFLLFLHNCPFFALSQNQHVQFEHIGINMGLSQSNVISIFQDSRGFMWFGTRDGLNRYDGYKFTVYKYNAENTNSPSHNTIMDIAEDDYGNLWLPTWGGGLNKFDWKKEKFTRFRYNAEDETGIANDYIRKVLKDSDGNLWIATEQGLDRYDKITNRFIHHRHNNNDPGSLSDDRVNGIAEDAQHNLWISTISGGINLFDKKTKKFRHFRHDVKNDHSLSSDNCLSVFIDSKNRLWVGTRGAGLNLFDREKEIFIHYKANPHRINSLSANVITAINEDEAGNIWLGTENGGLSLFNATNGVFDNYLRDDADNTSVNDNSIWSVFKDAKGNMWVGTFSAGVNFASRDANKFDHFGHSSSPHSLSNNNVLSIFEDAKENVWIGTDGGGLNLLNNKKGIFTAYKHDAANKKTICGNFVLAVAEDSGGDLWIGTWANGITVFNKAKNTFKHFKYDPLDPNGLQNANAWSITEDTDKNMWIGTYGGGISQYNRKMNNFTNYSKNVANPTSLSNNFVNIVYCDKKGNLWIATNGTGLDLFNKKTKTFTHFTHRAGKNSISNNDVFSLTEDAQGNLWIGTGLGLNRMDAKTHQFTSYYIKDGLPGNTIAGLLFDNKGNLWISTFNGISRFNPLNGTFKNFDINDGLQSNEFKMNSCFKSRSGKMYFGGINGFNSFFPDNILEKKYEPPLIFTDFQIFNKKVPISKNGDDKSILKRSITDTKEMVLSYSQSVISFEFATLNFVYENKKQYSYMLENFDKDWNYIGTRHTATYTNLNPGTYIFKVKGLNNEGQWSAATASIRLTITPPYWMTWWFRLVIVITALLAVIGFYKFRTRIIKAQKTKLQQLIKEQTLQLILSAEEEHKARRQAEQANIELERKNKELEQFAYIASHDMQEPLRTTSSFVELLQNQYNGKLDDRADKYLSFIAQSSDRMKVLIKDLLDYSRIGRKKELEKVNCEDILTEVLADLNLAIKEAQAVVIADALPVIFGYTTEIKQLFQNLIINGIKFRKKNVCPQINISVKKLNTHWQFAFKDNGIGIEQQYNERIFIIFQRLHTRTEYEGSGIGLSHCKKIVELHHGKIWVTSVNGEGSTFHFTLLIQKDQQALKLPGEIH